MRYAQSVADLVGNTPLVRLNRVTDGIARHGAREGRVLQSGRLVEGPHRAQHHRRGRARRAAASPAARSSSRRAATPASGSRWSPSSAATACVFVVPDKVAEDKRAVLRAYGAEVVVAPTARRAGGSALVLQRLGSARRRDPRRVQAQPVRQPERPAQPLRDDRPGDLARHRRPRHALRRRHRHGRHDHRRRALPARSLGRRRADRRRRPGRAPSTRADRCTATTSRASARTSGPTRTTRTVVARDPPHQRRRVVRDDPAARPRGGPARRRVQRHGGRRRHSARRRICPRTPSSSCCCPTTVADT